MRPGASRNLGINRAEDEFNKVMIQYDLLLLATLTGLPIGELAAELAAYVGAGHGVALTAEVVADAINHWVVEHFGEKIGEKYAPKLFPSHDADKPGHNEPLPPVNNIPPTSSCKICTHTHR